MDAYGSDAGLEAWLTAQGLALPAGANAGVLRQLGSAYIDAAYEARLSCSTRTGGFNQALAWPRTGHFVNGQPVPDDLIPQAWIYASYRAAYLESQTKGWTTSGQNLNRVTKREKVDVIEREFFGPNDIKAGDAAPGMAVDAVINGMVQTWLCSNVRRLGDLFRVI